MEGWVSLTCVEGEGGEGRKGTKRTMFKTTLTPGMADKL